MDLKSLRAFKKVCETGSISKAADALYISSRDYQSMARLEAEAAISSSSGCGA
ncbi:MAG: LysR family transcriptional regulator [Adlercreutzia equolifaciens]